MKKSIVSKSIFIICNLLVVFLITLSCEKEELKSDIYFPIGRISVLNNEFTVITNNQKLTYEQVYDSCGGYWLKFNSSQLENSAEVVIRFTSNSQPTEDFMDDTHLENWLKPSYYIDNDEETIVNKALEITEGLDSIMLKATMIHQFVAGYLEYYADYDKPPHAKASKTLEDGIGVCINFSRLYVALCRAAGVPARSVWGIVDGLDGLYHHHHQWAEVCDENGVWHICDFGDLNNGFFNNNIHYIDLVYGAEENLSITGFTQWVSHLTDVEFNHNYPSAHTGSIPNFELVSRSWPDSVVVKCTINF